MKNKFTKLFVAVILISGSVIGQENKQAKDILSKTNVDSLKEFALTQDNEYKINYNKAVEIAKSKNKPINGVDDEGNVFALRGYNESTGELYYVQTDGVSVKNDYFFNNSPTGSSLQTANAKPLHARNITGAGVTVGVWDGGAGLTNHLGFAGGRYQIKNNANSGADPDGRKHAAHVAGTVGANDFGDGEAMGFAYSSIIHAYNGIDQNDIPSMTTAATSATNPLILSNHSYGIAYLQGGFTQGIFGQYSSRTRSYDVLAYDAPYYTMVTSAGNSRSDSRIPKKAGGKDLLSWQAASKNVVVVAATRGTEDFANITGPSSVTGSNPFIASFSNYGPTDDFRIKPDIAAKGVDVKSVGLTNQASTDIMSGTSMATPAVTGVFALWQSYYNSIKDSFLKSASIRGLMAHTAREAGPAAGPDFMFGWGLLDANKGIELIDKAEAKEALLREFSLPQGSVYEYEFDYDGVSPLVATVSWTDPAGSVTTQTDLNVKKLVNDLDLRLTNLENNTVYYPWSLTQNWAIAPNATNIAVRNVDNARDNIEKIEPTNAVAGKYKLTLTHKGTLQNGKQDYTLILSGAGGVLPDTDGTVSTENPILKGINIYPNPVNDILVFDGETQNLLGSKIFIYDLSGKLIKNLDFNNSLDLSDLKSGSYLLTVVSTDGQETVKILKK